MGLSSSMLLDRVAGGMDASATHEEIYDEYCRVCPYEFGARARTRAGRESRVLAAS